MSSFLFFNQCNINSCSITPFSLLYFPSFLLLGVVSTCHKKNCFDVVVIGYGSRATKMSVNEQCRKLSKRVAFYTVDCRDSCGEIFVDLQDYKYTKKKLEETVECELSFPIHSLPQEAISVPWKLIPRRTAKLYFAMRDDY
ncbi:unnamed protein product [Brassica oleracea]